ncbi:hypothetical protein CRM22_002285 [Opisthorchis felineus]|uniref:Dynein light chain Tctex-type 1 n=1 Tax=Opisthorchis felineus TaxID=147828 RepID=A0A4S2MB81_OPIFE|nr:hypothetical protein CRM22_002285 [Opisthorchis felineus]
MDEGENQDQLAAFNGIEATGIVKEIVSSVIGTAEFSASRVPKWSSNIIEQSITQLAKLNRPFKYIVSCVLMQKNGAGLQTASACFWDCSTDGCYTFKWENKTMYCFVTIFGISI